MERTLDFTFRCLLPCLSIPEFWPQPWPCCRMEDEDQELLSMFSRRIRVEYSSNGQRKPCELKWLDSFSMRNFTNDPVFDDTLPLGDGRLEIGSRVPLNPLRDAMEDWFKRKSYIGKADQVVLTEE